jgi:F-type H+-transporting ATPase subunit b
MPNAAITPVASSSGSFLITPNVGLMIWTLLLFGLSMLLLRKLAFPRISQALDRRQKAIEDAIDTAERTREAADKLLEEYREKLRVAREQADEIVARARQAAETHEREGQEKGRELVAEATKRAERDIEAATQRALQEIRKEVADLTVMATEKVTRKTLNEDDQRRLVEEALGELDFSGLSHGRDN